MTAPPIVLRCAMTKDCPGEVAYLDAKGYIYCEPHGKDRQAWQRCRKLTTAEIAQLERGEAIARY